MGICRGLDASLAQLADQHLRTVLFSKRLLDRNVFLDNDLFTKFFVRNVFLDNEFFTKLFVRNVCSSETFLGNDLFTKVLVRNCLKCWKCFTHARTHARRQL